MSFDFTGRDLAGNIILTRSASDAKLTGAFSKYTHYVPFYRYCGTENTGLMEGTWLAMRNTLKLDQEYFDKYKNDPERRLTSTELQLRIGSKIQLYMPSTVVGNGVEGTGGYEGQGSPSKYTLSANRPFIVTMEIRDTVSNPSNARVKTWTNSATATAAGWSTARKPTKRRKPSFVRPIPKTRTTPM
ncbi:MAG: hypothetical protein ACLRMJ_08865 [Alistipes finegoldii]